MSKLAHSYAVVILSGVATAFACQVAPSTGSQFGDSAADTEDGSSGESGDDDGGSDDASSSAGTGESSGNGDESDGGGNGGTPQTCGNGTLEGTEECDQNDFGFRTCQTYGFMAGMLTCKSDCTADPTSCSAEPICGDGTITGLESCEAADLAGATCESLELGTGDLACAADCTFDAAACSCKGKGEPCQYNAADPSDPGGCCPAGYKGNEQGNCLTIPFQTCT